MTGESVEVVAVAVALIVATLATMMFGELLPKNLAIADPVGVAKAVQAAGTGVHQRHARSDPGIERLRRGTLRIFGLHTQEELASARSPDELLSLVRHSAEEGSLSTPTARLVTRSLAFGEKRAGEVMTPRTRMMAIEVGATIADFLPRRARPAARDFP